jgi:Tfp pilus assembly protein PilV
VNRQSGFTVLETLIAFSILAVAMVTLMSVVTQSSVRSGKLAATQQTIEVSENILNRIHLDILQGKYPASQALSGVTTSGHRWQAQLALLDRSAGSRKQSVLPLWRVTLKVAGTNNDAKLDFTTIVPGK